MMNGLLVALMMAALSAGVCTSVSLMSTRYTTEQEILKALTDFSQASTPPSAKDSGILSANGKLPGTRWRKSDLLRPQAVDKRQDVTSYNLNSFGLRYGKRQQT
uniref:metastasis-suppressor KiSS-1 n=1 Tax=Semicossyphus pulcher TaxID=241346 RepID=UPI0037E98C58